MLPVDSIRHLADHDESTPAVTVTLNLLGQLENRTYPGSYATWSKPRHVAGAELLVYTYADGRGAPSRVRWDANSVLGMEHTGDHMAMVQNPAVEPPKPPAGPDQQQLSVVAVAAENGTTAGFIVMDGPVAPNVQKQIEETQSFDPIEEDVPPGSGTEVSVSPVNDPGTSSLWEPEKAEMVEDEGWKPRGRPSQHKDIPPRRSPRGKATRAVRGMGTVLLLGFALLGYNRNF